MKINYTSRLFFQKFYFKVEILTICNSTNRYNNYTGEKCQELSELRNWCKGNFKTGEYRISDYYNGKSVDGLVMFLQTVYLLNSLQKDKIIQKFGNSIQSITQPFDSEHQEQLDFRNEIVYRKNLIYKKYKYAVYFKYDRKNEIWKWLCEYTQDEKDMLINPGYFSPVVYMKDDEHLVMIKLSWSEKIKSIKTVHLI
jgi:hypothetical protein